MAFRVGERENEQAWKDLLEDLKGRGVKEINLWIRDGNQAMKSAIPAKFGPVPRHRCVVHKMDNVLSFIPSKEHEQLKPEVRAWFYQKDPQAADQAVAAFIEKYQKSYPSAIECLQRESCGVFDLLLLSQGALEEHSQQQWHGATRRLSQAAFP